MWGLLTVRVQGNVRNCCWETLANLNQVQTKDILTALLLLVVRGGVRSDGCQEWWKKLDQVHLNEIQQVLLMIHTTDNVIYVCQEIQTNLNQVQTKDNLMALLLLVLVARGEVIDGCQAQVKDEMKVLLMVYVKNLMNGRCQKKRQKNVNERSCGLKT